MPKRSPEQFARIAYQAYGEHVGWRNYQGLPMPAWADLGERIQGAWAAACAAVRRRPAHRSRSPDPGRVGELVGDHVAAAGGGSGEEGEGEHVVV